MSSNPSIRTAAISASEPVERRRASELFWTLIRAVSAHWPEYCIEAVLLGLFMISACVFTTVLELPSSMVRQNIPSAFLRRVLTGIAMGITAVGLIYSPFGQRSGAQMNPSVTLAFYRLGRIKPVDTMCYIASQLAGGVAGVLIARILLGDRLAAPQVRFAATVPGASGLALAIAGEFVISFLLMTVVLHVSADSRLARFTGLAAGLLVATYITLEAPLSGMSMNPARTLASAVHAKVWVGVWIYVVVPPLAMLAAGELYMRRLAGAAAGCCKLYHNPQRRCIFCGANGGFYD